MDDKSPQKGVVTGQSHVTHFSKIMGPRVERVKLDISTSTTLSISRPIRAFNWPALKRIIIRPHRSTTYVDAVYCYRLRSVVCRSVNLYVCHTSEPC